MKFIASICAILLIGSTLLAESAKPAGAEAFVRSVIESLLAGGTTVPFDVAPDVIAMDNGEKIPQKDFKAVWPELAKEAFREKVAPEAFFDGLNITIYPVAGNRKLMSNERVMRAYKHQDGDLYCEASRKETGEDALIGYDKAFVYVIRKVKGQWTLVGIGG